MRKSIAIIITSICKSCCRTRHFRKIHIITERLALYMHLQNFFSSFYISDGLLARVTLTVKTARTQDRRIKDIHAVRRRHHNDAFVDSKTIHLYKQLV